MANKTRYIIDPVERETNNRIRQEAAAKQAKIDEAVRLQRGGQANEQEEDTEDEIDLTPPASVFYTQMWKKGWYNVINQDGNVVDEDGMIPAGETKALRLRAAENLVKRLNKEA